MFGCPNRVKKACANPGAERLAFMSAINQVVLACAKAAKGSEDQLSCLNDLKLLLSQPKYAEVLRTFPDEEDLKHSKIISRPPLLQALVVGAPAEAVTLLLNAGAPLTIGMTPLLP